MIRLLFILIFLVGNTFGYSQPCNDPLPPSNTCAQAPLLCNLDGYCSDNSAAKNSGTPDAFCGVVENNNWVSFIAGSNEFTLEINVTNCRKNRGLQAQFFSTSNCNNFRAVSQCVDPALGRVTLSANNLTIGETYYLMMDGKGGDVCDYKYTMISGLTLSPTHAEIQASGIFCGNDSLTLTSIGASNEPNLKYKWSTLDGHIFTNASTSIGIDQPGTYKLVISSDGGCTDSTEIIIPYETIPMIEIASPAIINCVSRRTVDVVVTTDIADARYLWLTTNGHIVSGAITPKITVDQPGVYFITIINPISGCSNIKSIEVFADVESPFAKLTGGGELNCVTPSITLDGTGSTVGTDFVYQWTSNTGNLTKGHNELIAVADKAGIYYLEIFNKRNECISIADIEVTLNDEKPSGADIAVYHPCFGEQQGEIEIDTIWGGNLPNLISFNQTDFQSQTVFDSLVAKDYNILIRDEVGCEWDTIISIVEQNELILDLGANQIIDLGESIQLDAKINFPDSSIETMAWMPSFECDSCLIQNFTPVNTTNYHLKIVDQNGCSIEDNVQVIVNKKRNIYFPSAFSPNFDGINDKFYIFGGIGIETIVVFDIYDRWGNLISSFNDFQPNDSNFGWDGSFNGKIAQKGVYVFYAQVKYIDGEVLDYTGDLTIL